MTDRVRRSRDAEKAKMAHGYTPAAAAATLLPAISTSPMAARDFARKALARWPLSPAQRDDVLLVVDELVTNAVIHGSGAIRLSLDLVDQSVRIEVADESSARPAPRLASTTRTGGRGIALVAAIATAWGSEPDLDGGKYVWAEIPLSR